MEKGAGFPRTLLLYLFQKQVHEVSPHEMGRIILKSSNHLVGKVFIHSMEGSVHIGVGWRGVGGLWYWQLKKDNLDQNKYTIYTHLLPSNSIKKMQNTVLTFTSLVWKENNVSSSLRDKDHKFLSILSFWALWA